MITDDQLKSFQDLAKMFYVLYESIAEEAELNPDSKMREIADALLEELADTHAIFHSAAQRLNIKVMKAIHVTKAHRKETEELVKHF